MISSDAVATLICPEAFAYKTPTESNTAVALGTGMQQAGLTTNSSGNLGVFIIPDGEALVVTGNDNFFNPNNGTNGATWNSTIMRLMKSDSTVEDVRCSALSVIINMTTNNNTNGTVSMAYMNEDLPTNVVSLDTYAVPRSTILNQ